jgi:hypothetical protein
MPVDLVAPIRFIRVGYEADDWVAVFLKSYATGRVAQRVGPVSRFTRPTFQAWLRAENAAGVNVYVSVNVVEPHRRSRKRSAIRAIRHVFLEADSDAEAVLRAIADRHDLPAPSYVLHSSPSRAHVFWRARGFTTRYVEALQRQLARELGTDLAATPCSQMTRLPGFFNHKYATPHLVTIEYKNPDSSRAPADFPSAVESIASSAPPTSGRTAKGVERARSYVAAIPPAVTGAHGDLHTFRVCCRLVRGFALSDEEALAVLAEWNARCQPPWSERELRDKCSSARRYGREPIAGRLEAQS